MAKQTEKQKSNFVLGRVVDRLKHPLANLLVNAYSRDIRGEELLGESITDREGKYKITWTLGQLSGIEKKEADISIKVFTREKKTLLFASDMDSIRFNASPREEINITVTEEIKPEVAEYDYIFKEVSLIAKRVPIIELQENKEHRDITFLSKEAEIPTEKLHHMVVAHRLQAESKIPAAFFYALLRKNTLLKNDFIKSFHARLVINIDTEIVPLLYDAALVDEKTIQGDVDVAAKEMVVSTQIVKECMRNVEQLKQYKKKAEDYYKNEQPQKAINLLTNFFKDGKLQEIQQLFSENKNDLNGFLDKITDPSFYDSNEKAKDATTNIALGKLFGFGNEIIPQIAKSKGIKKPEDARKLAKLNKDGWVEEITKARPDIKDKKLISTYASTIVRKMEKEFPTMAFAAQLEREKNPVLNNQDKIVSFFNKHEDFDLMKHNVDLYLKEKKVTEKDNEAINEELKSVQRVFKLIPNYSKTLALRNEKIHSSQSIVAIGETRFIKEVAPKAGIEEKEAKEIFHKAETKHTAAMLMAGDLHDSMSVMDIASFETTTLAKKLEAVSKDFPNLKSLFKLTDTCECEHCRSVYSPAAYLVEILQFLNKRMVVANNAKSVLFERRPDLGEIDLGCANANTPVKYIDLVCEILEEAIAPNSHFVYTGKLSDGADPLKGVVSASLLNCIKNAQIKLIDPVTGNPIFLPTNYQISDKALVIDTGIFENAKPVYYLRDKNIVFKIVFEQVNAGENEYKVYRLRQTFDTAEELDAAPEYVNESAYHELRNKAFAFKLPFDLQHTEAKAYFSRFDINRADLMKTFQSAATPSEECIAAERLDLTDAERMIIANAPVTNNNAAQQVYWNVPAPGDVVDYLKQVNNFLERSELTYKELDLLLKLKFIDKNGNLFIKHNYDDLLPGQDPSKRTISCDTAKKEIANLDLDVLDRIHRFIRLQKKTGWKYEVLDEIISQSKLGNGLLNDSCLVKAARLKEISGKVNIKIEELIGCLREFPHLILQEDAPKPLYHQVFLNKAKNGVVDKGLLPEKVDGSQLLSTYIGYISTCLQLKQKDLKFITPLLPDDNLTFSNFSYLFAASRLIRKLKLKAEEFAIITKLSGIDISISPDKFLEFIKIVEDFKNSPLEAADVKFILNHEATNLNDRVIKIEKIEELLGKLKTGYKKINDEQKSNFNGNFSAEEQKETLINVLSRLDGLIDEDIKTIVKFLDRDWTDVTDSAGAKTFINNKFNPSIDRTNINAAVDALNALAPGADISSEQKVLLKSLLDSIADFQIKKGKQTLLKQILSSSFKIDLALVGIILQFAKLKQPAPGTDLISTLLTDNFVNPITQANYSKQYAAIKLLYKIVALLNAFELSNTDVQWYFKNNANLAIGWFEFDNIPYDTGQTAINFSKYIEFTKILAYSKQFTAVLNPLDPESPISFFSIVEMLLLPSGTVNRDIFLYTLALLTGNEKEDLDAIDAHLFATFDIANYKNTDNWKRVLDCADFVRKLGAGVVQIKKYINPILSASEVSDLRATLKSRYDEDTWLHTLKEIMDAIRPQKRNALIAYLLATNSEMKDENDLYEYFLIDVEMEACMPSSRIVQAHNSIQLFIQRCLMGLEPDSIADVEKDPNWNQWKWMKNYRVWEANRKVFLYPENWYDVTLTDDKSYLLNEFINEIQQNELTNDSAEEAIKKYLEKLDSIAFLEVMATWYDTINKNMHVFARTKGGDPAIYYYRRFEKERYWTPWEKVELDITGDHLLAFMHNNRLHLAWPMFSEEAKPDQQSKVPSNSDQGTYVDAEKPMKKLKIQLAISEYTNKKWHPKRVSKDSILTPSDYTSDNDYFKKDKYNLLYFQNTEQVFLFSSVWTNEVYLTLNGIFDIAGCKGYPELVFEGNKYFSDFYPDFKDAELKSQRYFERPIEPNFPLRINPDDLSIRNGISPFNFYEILGKTPGKFKISYPHQFTNIDLIALIYELFLMIINSGNTSNKGSSYVTVDRKNRFKIPLGTLLPYFEEDSKHAYVIIPGFYRKEENDRILSFVDAEKRTASNVFQLIEDIVNWIKKIYFDFKTNPPADDDAAIQRIITNSDFQDILTEISKYEALDFILNLLIGKTGNDEFDIWITELKDSVGLVYGEQFKNMYHPLVCALRSILYKDGIPALMKRDTQLFRSDKVAITDKAYFEFEKYYKPNAQIVPKGLYKNDTGIENIFPIEDIDFTSDGSYSVYNWDLFFRVPLHIANSLTKNQRFEEAMSWFHYMFNPTGALPGNGVQKYWVTKPFYLNQNTDYESQRIDSLMYSVADKTNPNIKELEFAIEEWRNKPFRPDVVARFRPVAYQKALLMKYIDNLTEWGDYLFRQDTMESVAQATQMYILADKLLGPKPRIIPAPIKQPYETYNQIEAKLDKFGNALIELENILPDLSVLPEGGNELPPSPVTLGMLYFCVPSNDKMFEYWDRVADRLFKIRHCQNIDGIERSLALFAPPIDPGMLVRAAAAGLDISSIIAGINAPTPYYRFNVLSQKATELAQEVRGLGNSLLQALEKKDAEALTLLRNELELKVLNAVKDIKKLQINESKEQIEVLKRTKKVTEERQKYYSSIQKIISKEQLNLDKLKEANEYQVDSQIIRTIAGALRLIPEFHVGASGFGGSPSVVLQLGGSAMSTATSIGADILNILGSIASYEASRASILGGYDRRFDDWKLQERLAIKELASIEKQITAAEIRKEIAETDLRNHELQIDNAKKTDEFMRSKFTNKELYDWMIGQISAVYFRSYQLAHDFAKKAERCYRFELGNDDTFISYGYWDSMKKGLQSADNLIHDIKRMDTGYLDKNKREYEITKHVSLALLDPLALVRLRATGICDFEIPEAIYDMDHPGQYFRRLKSVSVSLPCVAGPYTSVSAKLSLVNNRYRKNANDPTNYAEDPGNDIRFVYNIGAIQSIATSNAQNDSGVFELNFRDERYLPFENTGAISSWRLELPTEIKQFDYNTISDVIVHVKYTAREGGSGLKTEANKVLKDQLDIIRQGLDQGGLHVAINMKHDLPNEWHLLQKNETVDLKIDKSRLPYLAQTLDSAIEEVIFVAKVKTDPATFPITLDGVTINLSRIDEWKLCKGINSDIELDTVFTLSVLKSDLDNLSELLMVIKYSF
jgi:hypothetical protein